MADCPSCSFDNPVGVDRCQRCGKRLSHTPETPPPEAEPADDTFPLDERESLGDFGTAWGADCAASFLRAQGIAVQVGAEMYPGIHIRELWVRRQDAAAARELLAAVEAAQEAVEDPGL